MALTRDSVVLTVGAIGAGVTAAITAFNMPGFEWIPLNVRHILLLVSVIVGPILAFLKSSPLPISPAGKVDELSNQHDDVVKAIAVAPSPEVKADLKQEKVVLDQALKLAAARLENPPPTK